MCAGLPWAHPYCNREEIRGFDYEDERFTRLLRQVYGTKVQLPFGYNPEGGVWIKFFNLFLWGSGKKGRNYSITIAGLNGSAAAAFA